MMKPFQPSLAPVKEHRLHHCLVELGSDACCYILPSQHLTDACPYSPSLADLLPHSLDIVVVLGEEASEVLEQPSVPEEMHQQGITLARELERWVVEVYSKIIIAKSLPETLGPARSRQEM